MNIIAYQLEDDTCRFIYSVSGSFRVVSVENHSGMQSFLSHYGNTRINKDVDIYQYAKDLEVAYTKGYEHGIDHGKEIQQYKTHIK
jgi:hypothetical protein